ncbi:xanthine phosphoribosyltransferase [Clostridium mediterraneense]|uniref:xanthine phosphoribosyltransferase n=1 Tax=Clostridium mediterraneense TaxID=1805472 RepID=UPI00082BE00B|nr:xanthine phosphoribosyltransferase [Clostridium mediterraneense]
MELLKQKIREEGRITEDNILMVDSFLNHQMDVDFIEKIGKEFKNIFKEEKIDKILTVESTGIAIGAFVAREFGNLPLVFGKKVERLSREKADKVFHSEIYSFTKQTVYNVVVDKKFIKPGEKILIVDDFLANACGIFGLLDVVKQAGAEVVGAGIVIEKGFQDGRKHLENKGIRVESLAIIDKIENNEVIFR